MTKLETSTAQGWGYYVVAELGEIVGTIEFSRRSDIARYICYKGQRYVGQCETLDYALKHYFA